MKARVWSILLAIVLVSCTTFGQGGQNTVLNKGVVAFVNVNVIPMDRERVIENQTVIVRDGRISEIGAANKVKVPEGAQRVEGQGKYLMPGIAEMHGHLPHPNLGEAVANSFLVLFIANGITTVRGMYGFPNHPAIREKIAKGELLGPRLYVASPALSGNAAKTPADGEKLVREYKAAGFDLLKIHEGLSKETYDKIVAVANELSIPYGGHVPNDVGLLHALKSRQSSIEHLDGYVEALETGDVLDEKKIPSLVKATLDAGAWGVPTQALWQAIYGTESVESLRARPELKYVPTQMVNQWAQQKTNQLNNAGDGKEGQKVLDMRDKVLKALSDGGAKILLGSDAPQLFSVPGFSLMREMQVMAKAGMSPYKILESGTRNPAAYLKAEKDFGTVETGKVADLILLDANPLADVANMTKRSGVMVRGKWFSQSELQKMLDDIAASYAAK
jgi:imidazolonepropionase-like amidohydrolase